MTARLRITRLVDGPILPPAPLPPTPASGPQNINGPSLIRVPEWVEAPLGRYYLYYADHKGDRIKLAYANALEGPWRTHSPGALHLRDTPFLHEAPEVPSNVDREMLARPRADGVPSPLDDCVIPHIASPEVVVDEDTRSFRLYYHGLEAFGLQPSRVATSRDGLSFDARAEILGRPYLRVFRYRDLWYGLAMPGQLYRSESGIDSFEPGPLLFGPDMRHCGLWLRGDELWVFWTRVGDAPERILLSKIALGDDWERWRTSDEEEVLRPEREWEGAAEPLGPSHRSAVDRPVNQLRDPDIFVEGESTYLVYAIAGECGIAIARLEDAPPDPI